MRKILWCLVAVAVCVLTAPGSVSAAPILSVTNTTGYLLVNPPFTLGFSFTAQNAMNLTALGIFDDSQNGLAESHQLGLWDAGGNLLASATIGSGTSGTLIGNFRYVDLATVVTLAAGQTYQIGALYTSGADPLIFPGLATGFTTDPSIAFLQATFAGGGTLVNPNVPAGASPSYFGPNALLSPVPEPATMAVFGLMAAGGMGYVRRRVKGVATA